MESEVDTLGIEKHKFIGKTNICYGSVKVTDQVTGFVRVHTQTGRKMALVILDVPPTVFTTDQRCACIADHYIDLLGSLHAAEHAAIGIMPLIILAARSDLGGIAKPYYPQTESPGGAGLSHQAYRQAERLLESARDMIDR